MSTDVNQIFSCIIIVVLSGYMEAINITAIAGDKGKDPYTCQVRHTHIRQCARNSIVLVLFYCHVHIVTLHLL